MTVEHPVTLGNLRVHGPNSATAPFVIRPATIADLVSALRAEGAVERMALGMSPYDSWADYDEMPDDSFAKKFSPNWWRKMAIHALDALAEAQPLPPAGGS